MNETGDEATRDKEYPKLAGNYHYFGRTKVCRGRNCSGLCWNRVFVPKSLSYIDARFYLRRQHYTCLPCKIKYQIASSLRSRSGHAHYGTRQLLSSLREVCRIGQLGLMNPISSKRLTALLVFSQTSAMHNENQYETLQAKISFRRVSEQRKAGVSN